LAPCRQCDAAFSGRFAAFSGARATLGAAGLYFASQWASGAEFLPVSRHANAEPKPKGQSMTEKSSERIKSIIDGNDVVLFMKGVPAAPQCGFSAAVVQVLNGFDVKYDAVNVLADPFVREGIKAFSNWPTIPQLYVKGEFVGGCDIVREMAASGELTQLFADKGVAKAPV
jgi:monothiol glutaredoxin